MFALIPLLLFLAADVIDLYPFPPKDYQETARVSSRDLRTTNRLYRVYFDKKSKAELFKLAYGWKVEGEWINYWRQTLIAHGDFNQDGREDYCWYAGDDTSSNQVLILSRSEGYQRIDLYKALAAAWRIRNKKEPPDFAVAADYDCHFALETSGTQLTLIATISKWGDAPKQVIRIPLTPTN
jgi:hypothetical protein